MSLRVLECCPHRRAFYVPCGAWIMIKMIIILKFVLDNPFLVFEMPSCTREMAEKKYPNFFWLVYIKFFKTIENLGVGMAKWWFQLCWATKHSRIYPLYDNHLPLIAKIFYILKLNLQSEVLLLQIEKKLIMLTSTSDSFFSKGPTSKKYFSTEDANCCQNKKLKFTKGKWLPISNKPYKNCFAYSFSSDKSISLKV